MAARQGRRLGLGWLVSAILLVATFSVFFVDGFVHPTIANDAQGAIDRDDGSDAPVAESVLDGGPAIANSTQGVRSVSMPARTIALTFDDGPDPTWTPQILDVLRRYNVPATFFVVGTEVVQYPDVVRAMRAAGSEVGIHTFTHVDLATVDNATIDQEIERTQTALAGAIGETSYLTRPPYSSGPSSLTQRQFDVVRHLSDIGQLTVLSDVDSRDWERSGVPRILDAAWPEAGQGAIVLFHDGGGDRSETVAALDKLIPQMLSDGYRFTTVTDGLGLRAGNQPAPTTDHRSGSALLTVVTVATTVMQGFQWLLLLGLGLVAVRLVVVVVLATRHKRLQRTRWTNTPPVTDTVSVIVPAYNERDCIASTVRSLVASTHPLEIIVVDDGSTDGTADIVADLGLPGVRIVRQANAGKSAALNTGIALATNDLIVMMDGDTIFEPGTIRELIAPFGDPRVGAVAGNAKITNRSSLLTRMQHIEYVIGFSLDRRAYDLLRCMPTVPGAVGAFRREALANVGGLSDDTLAEDTDLTMAIVAAGYRVVYQENAVAWTEAPATPSQLWRQRYRWSYGTMQSMWKHRRAKGGFGRIALAQHALFQVVLPLVAPLIDAFFVYGMIFIDAGRTALAWGAVLAMQMLLAAYAFLLDKERLSPLLLMPLQQVAYRQLMYAVLIKSVASAIGGVRLRWHKLQRSGVANAAMAAAMAPSVPAGRSQARPAARRIAPPTRPRPHPRPQNASNADPPTERIPMVNPRPARGATGRQGPPARGADRALRRPPLNPHR